MKPYFIEEYENGLLIFRINRPEKRNAINYEVMDGLETAIHMAGKKSVKALAITGEGDQAFCSGGDLSSFHSLKTENEAFEMLSRMAALLKKLLFLRKPTIAILNGTAVGGGCELAAACDYRIAKAGIKAGFIQGTLAITTGWGGGSIIMEKMLPANAMRMVMEAKLYAEEELKELGFIHTVFQGDSADGCLRFLERMLRLESEVLEAYKDLLVNKWAKAGLEERIDQEVRRCSVLWEGEAHHAKVDSFLNKL
ncbi:enoyl-CoA hydratase [Cytobacillus firmus]|uniref:enoyl-CoA hydratase/isomerase family protein n=1 Tax=Cytobacillus firmus TaxID=1399 RepID=UPI00077C8411|nr:enoyl-CoA hydratase/isomerase family protein [Cytobacillus firmus]MBG9544108.1 enoyl-CoA hydratase [Cytobacillus firmus]MBG9550678.1 enoyl-CoA hydratase [Cytobacillus firmus]MBG9556477.1 enoyl-CoA hydratase [Cytobacillus firmus]MBG9574569.1 enoyl-CoA hydratase [Cytobacillus firmus]MEC1892652.1 enoyl-CoA hydratase/isomerase family protein [Cytobacillus firmus]